MTNGNDVARAKHLESAAINVKRYILNEILDLSQAIVNDISSLATNNDVVLDTVASTVDGGFWYETTSTAPIIKFKQGGSTYYLYTNQLVSPNLTLSSSTVTATSGSTQTVTLTYSGEGTITLSNPNETALTATYDASTKTITLKSNVAAGSSATVSLGIALSESGNYAADSQTLTVTCQGALLDPQLTVTPSSATISEGETATATVSYAGNGILTVWDDSHTDINDDLDYNTNWVSYDASTKVLSVDYYEPVVDTWSSRPSTLNVYVSLSAAGSYSAVADTLVFTVNISGGASAPIGPVLPR